MTTAYSSKIDRGNARAAFDASAEAYFQNEHMAVGSRADGEAPIWRQRSASLVSGFTSACGKQGDGTY
jgi:hypothetical protein